MYGATGKKCTHARAQKEASGGDSTCQCTDSTLLLMCWGNAWSSSTPTISSDAKSVLPTNFTVPGFPFHDTCTTLLEGHLLFFSLLVFTFLGWKVAKRTTTQKNKDFQPSNHWYFLKSIAGANGRRTAVQIGGDTNWRCIAVFPFLQGLDASEAQRYKLGAYLSN